MTIMMAVLAYSAGRRETGLQSYTGCDRPVHLRNENTRCARERRGWSGIVLSI